MRIVNMLFNVRCFRLSYSIASAAIVVLFSCSPLWGYLPDLRKQQPSAWLPNDCEDPIAAGDRLIGFNNIFAKRDSNNQYFQQWQDLSPKEQEKMRKKYREWQSLPPQKRKLYKQLFRQWQHLSPKERKKLQKDLDNWENLSPKQRNSIRRRFRN